MENLVIENGVLKDGKAASGVVIVPEGVTEIGRQAFYRNKEITGLELPEGVTKIGSYSMNGCPNLVYVVVPESVTEFGDDALVRGSETNVTFKHTMDTKYFLPEIRCKEGSPVDLYIKDILSKDGLAPSGSHSDEHVVTVVYQ